MGVREYRHAADGHVVAVADQPHGGLGGHQLVGQRGRLAPELLAEPPGGERRHAGSSAGDVRGRSAGSTSAAIRSTWSRA